MGSSYASSGDEAEAMAKAMGFSSFGTQGPTKKRKFNPKIDAMVEGQELAALDRGGGKGQGSGGNQVPLGKARVFGNAPKSNQEEIDLGVDDEDEEEPAYIATSVLPVSKEGDSEEEEGPAYIDTSLPPPNEDARIVQQKIDTILTSSASAPILLDSKSKTNCPAYESSRGPTKLTSLSQDEPRPPFQKVVPVIGNGQSNIDSYHPKQRGQKNELWYIGYYDPSFNENPWAKLEHANGLEPVGTWIQRDGRKA